MTLDLQTSRVVFKGNGVAVEFPFDFKVWDASQIAVFVSDDPDGINEMEVTPQKVILTESGGTVTYTLEGKPLPEGYTLSIVRNMPFIQEDMYITGTRFNPEVIETRFDKDCAERQQILEMLSRCIKVSVTSGMTPEQLLKAIFKAYHDILESLEKTGSITGAIPVVATGTTEPRPLKDRFADIVNVKDFGAVGDGEIIVHTVEDTSPILFVIAGASNAEGMSEETSPGEIIVNGAYSWDDYSMEWVTPVRNPVSPASRGGFIPALAQKLQSHFSPRDLYFINGGVSGSTVASALYQSRTGNWSAYGNLQLSLLGKLNNAIKKIPDSRVVFGGVIWWGGGNDRTPYYNGEITLSDFTDSYAQILDWLHAVFGTVYHVRLGNALLNEEQQEKGEDLIASTDSLVENRPWVITVYDHGTLTIEEARPGDGHPLQKTYNKIGMQMGNIIIENNNIANQKSITDVSGTNDTKAFSSFNSDSRGLKYIPSGGYRIDNNLYNYSHGRIGNGVYHSDFNFVPGKIFDSLGGQLIYHGEESVDDPSSMVHLSKRITSSSINNDVDTTIPVVLYAEHQQNGSSNMFSHSIMGYAENNGTGDNDVVAVSGRSAKTATAGCGDSCGVWGSAYQNSQNVGLVTGVSSHIYQNCSGTKPGALIRGVWSGAGRFTSVSTGSPANCGIMVDALTGRQGQYGFWNGIVIDKSCFIHDGLGVGSSGKETVAINLSSFDNNTFPEYGIKFGNCRYHIRAANVKPLVIWSNGINYQNGSTINFNIITEYDENYTAGNTYIRFKKRDRRSDENEAEEICRIVAVPSNGYMYLTSTQGACGVIIGSDVNKFLRPLSDNSIQLGTAIGRWSNVFAATDSINTSDAREKQDIAEYPDDVLDAWGEVELRQFIFKDSVAKKGDEARIHAGVIAQQVMEAFAAHNLDATRYGLLCHDEWQDEYEDVTVVDSEAVLDADGNEVMPAQTHTEKRLITAAGDRYGIRYSEALCLEAAYQRRRAERIEARLAALETKLGVV